MLAIIESLRPKQWVKNVFVFAPLVFSLQFMNFSAWLGAVFAAVAFVCVSGTVYIFNDIFDIESDRKHPTKKTRPIASGKLSIKAAWITAAFLLSISLIIASLLPQGCGAVLLTYLIINVLYTKILKHVAVLDVIIISAGFVLRVIVGGLAIDVTISPWIILATFMVTLFMGFGKRRYELVHVSQKLRVSMQDYNKEFLDKLINVTCASTFISYAIYAVETAQRIVKVELVYTVVFVAFGLFRYLHFLYLEKEGGAPEEIVFADKWFLGNAIIWLIVTVWILT